MDKPTPSEEEQEEARSWRPTSGPRGLGRVVKRRRGNFWPGAGPEVESRSAWGAPLLAVLLMAEVWVQHCSRQPLCGNKQSHKRSVVIAFVGSEGRRPKEPDAIKRSASTGLSEDALGML